MAENPAPPVVLSRPPSFWKVIQVGALLVLLLPIILERFVGMGGVGGVNLAPRPVTLSTGNLLFLAVLGAFGLAWTIICNMVACVTLVTRGYWGFWGPLFAIGSLSAILLGWALWDFQGTPCTVVLIAGFALTDGALIACGVWDMTGGRILRAARSKRHPS